MKAKPEGFGYARCERTGPLLHVRRVDPGGDLFGWGPALCGAAVDAILMVDGAPAPLDRSRLGSTCRTCACEVTRILTRVDVRPKRPRVPSKWEERFWKQCTERAPELPLPDRGFAFFKPARGWKFDFAWPDLRVAVEVEGNTWKGVGRHTSGTGFEDDCVKYAMAAMRGWLVLRVTATLVRKGLAVEWAARALAIRQAAPFHRMTDVLPLDGLHPKPRELRPPRVRANA